MSPLKPTCVRLAILAALAKNGITTLDDLQIQTGETRKKLQYSTMRAINLKLVERTQDDVTRLPAYRITPAGRKYLEKFGNGRTAEPSDPAPVVEKPQPAAPAAPAENTKQDRLEQELSDLRARHDALLARMSNVYRALGTSEDDARAEGAFATLPPDDSVRIGAVGTNTEGYRQIWESINGAGS